MDVIIDFVVDFQWTQQSKDFVIVIVGRLFKMTHFITFHNTIDASYIVDLYFREKVCLHGVLETST